MALADERRYFENDLSALQAQKSDAKYKKAKYEKLRGDINSNLLSCLKNTKSYLQNAKNSLIDAYDGAQAPKMKAEIENAVDKIAGRIRQLESNVVPEIEAKISQLNNRMMSIDSDIDYIYDRIADIDNQIAAEAAAAAAENNQTTM